MQPYVIVRLSRTSFEMRAGTAAQWKCWPLVWSGQASGEDALTALFLDLLSEGRA